MNVYGEQVLHIDMYRVEDVGVLYARGIIDQIDAYDAICIERPRWEEEYVDESWTRVSIQRGKGEERVVIVSK